MGRASVFYGRPAGELPPHYAAPCGWEVPNRIEEWRQARAAAEQRRPLSPPPRRDDAVYGPVAQNPAGDRAFHDARTAWYQRSTGTPLTGSHSMQHDLCHELARPFRADHTRSGREV